MKPELIQEETINELALSIANFPKTELELHNDRCPSGTVPILRSRKEDLIHAKYLSKRIKVYQTNNYPLAPMSHHHVSNHSFYFIILYFVSVQPSTEGKIYYGGKALINTQNPIVQKDQFSTGQIWIQNGPVEEINSIEFGWAVYPLLSKDNRTRLFGYWTGDGYKQTGCFNMLCSGFVQVHPKISLGSGFFEKSVYGGMQYVLTTMVYRDPQSGNWWLTSCDSSNQLVGYWPNELFTHLANNASVVRYGGVAGAEPNRPTPPMGNGHFPNKDYRKACYISNMKVLDDKGSPLNLNQSEVRVKQDTIRKCYDVKFNGFLDKFFELQMMFGGPGGMCP
ncbi:protein of unknown function DUF239 [Macleaya cordata]|uniref:Neprosin PEP catalytic domain-containing protein n=1 Tax=Macleaya cordata TaxID=56857 RepID=A0A200QTZ9_MACCD|nr:protein of unknown function DUF239 [Macleaya cordata]